MEYARYQEPSWQNRQSPAASGPASAITWLLIGIGIGAGAALLLAPSSGRELRGVLGRGFSRTMNGISRGTQNLRDRGSNLIHFNRPRMG